MKIDVGIKISSKAKKIIDGELKERIHEGLFVAGEFLRGEIVMNKLSGNPVHRRSGNLANSIMVLKKNDGIEVGTPVVYGKFLETANKFKGKYRWLVPSFQENKEKFKKIIKDYILGGKK